MSAIWRRQADEWRPLLPSEFANEEVLHDLVEQAPQLLPLSGDPALVIVGREVALGSGYADLVAVETDGRLALIEIKLKRNAEARRAVVAQVLTYAAFLKGVDVRMLEDEVLAGHIAHRQFGSLVEGAREADQTGNFDEPAFRETLEDCLATGSFRLVLVLDEAPRELVQLVGYLESISNGVILDLITMSTYKVGDEEILVPQRVDPEYVSQISTAEAATRPSPRSGAGRPKPVDGTEPFMQAVDRTDGATRESLIRLVRWAENLSERQFATLKSVLGNDRQILLVWLPGEKGGLVSIWNDKGAYISLWRSVFVRFAWDQIEPIETLTGKSMGQGSTISDPSEQLLELLTTAYEQANAQPPEWDGQTYYVNFGDDENRNWDDARKYGFVSAGGGAWYSRTLKQLQTGNRIYVYIPKGNGVGGYVGVGDVTAPPVPAAEFLVTENGKQVPITDVADADMTYDSNSDPEMAEWLAPVKWLTALPREQAVKDPDFFANQNSAVRLTHRYTIRQFRQAFGIDDASSPARH